MKHNEPGWKHQAWSGSIAKKKRKENWVHSAHFQAKTKPLCAGNIFLLTWCCVLRVISSKKKSFRSLCNLNGNQVPSRFNTCGRTKLLRVVLCTFLHSVFHLFPENVSFSRLIKFREIKAPISKKPQKDKTSQESTYLHGGFVTSAESKRWVSALRNLGSISFRPWQRSTVGRLHFCGCLHFHLQRLWLSFWWPCL